jgi:hypothetical protein
MQASTAGLEEESSRLAMAAFLVDEPAATATHRWIPALRRPTTVLRFGAGVDYSGPKSDSIRRQLSPRDDRRAQGSSQLTSVLGELAQPVFDQLQSVPWRGVSVAGDNAAATTVAAGQVHPQVPVTVLGVAPARRLVRAAQLADIDLLLLFDVQDKTTSSGLQSKSVQFSVWDTWTSREVFKAPRVNYLRRRHTRTDPLVRDPIDLTAESFAVFIREQLRPEPIPEALKSTHAARRVMQLAHLKRDNPLPLLSEIKFYRSRGLVGVDELLQAYQALLGSKSGSELLAGTIEEKRSALAPWIPDLQLHRVSLRRGE